jgi:hypothetical protein
VRRLYTGVAAIMMSVAATALGIPSAAGATWTLSADPQPGTNCEMNAVARVPGHSTVWGVGDCDTSALIERHAAGGTWTVVATPPVGGLFGVAAVSGRDVWVVGVNGQAALAYHWDGSSLTQVATAPTGALTEQLRDVTVASATGVWAVGVRLPAGGRGRTLAEHWDGHAWNLVPTPNANRLDNELSAVVAVPGTRRLWAFGFHLTRSGELHQLILHRDATGWHVSKGLRHMPAARLYGGAFVPGPGGGVWAVGESQGRPLIERHTARGWERVPSGSPAGPGILVAAAAIPGTSHLWAVGDSGELVIERWNGRGWRVTPSPQPAGCGGLSGVTALSASNAWAVGTGTSCGNSTWPIIERYH